MLIAILLLVTNIGISQAQPDTPAIKNGDTAEHTIKQKANKPQKQDSVESPNVICNCGAIQTQAGAETSNETPYNPMKDKLYRAYLIFTIIGVLIALGGIGALFWQTKHIRTQSQHLANQLEIQRRTARQWVQIMNLRQHRDPSRPDMIVFTFSVVNKSQNPLLADMEICEANDQTRSTGLLTYLVPESPFARDFSVGISPDQIALYEAAGLILTLKITIFFTDTFDQQWGERIEQVLACRSSENYLFAMETRTTMWRSEPKQLPNQQQATTEKA